MATIEDSLLPYLREKGDASINRDEIYNKTTFEVFFDLMKLHLDIEAQMQEEEERERERKNKLKNKSND